MQRGPHAVAIAMAATVATATLAPALHAQDAPTSDARWRPFLGCWTPEDAADLPRSRTEPVTCIVPDGAQAVRVITRASADGPVTSEDRVAADGRRAPLRGTDGCTGWEQGTWSADGERLYLAGEVTCGTGTRAGSGLMTMLADDIWLDVRTVRQGTTGGGLHVRRYLPALHDVTLPDGTRIPARRLATETDAAPARRTLGATEIVEASRALDSVVVEAWLTERRTGIALDRRTLAALVRDRVPVRTIDVLVALQHPEKFTVHKAGDTWADHAAAARAAGRASVSGGAGSGGIGAVASGRLGTSIFPWDVVNGGWLTPGVQFDPAVDLAGPAFRSSWGGINPRLAAWTNFNTMLAWPFDGPLYQSLVPIFSQTVANGGGSGVNVSGGSLEPRSRPAVVNGAGYTRDGGSLGSFITMGSVMGGGGEGAASGPVTGGSMGASGASSGGTTGGDGGRTAMPRPGTP